MRLKALLSAFLLWILFASQAYAQEDIVVFQPGPGEGKDIWTTSVFCYCPEGGGPGGGLDNYELVVGGWGDDYYTLIEFIDRCIIRITLSGLSLLPRKTTESNPVSYVVA